MRPLACTTPFKIGLAGIGGWRIGLWRNTPPGVRSVRHAQHAFARLGRQPNSDRIVLHTLHNRGSRTGDPSPCDDGVGWRFGFWGVVWLLVTGLARRDWHFITKGRMDGPPPAFYGSDVSEGRDGRNVEELFFW